MFRLVSVGTRNDRARRAALILAPDPSTALGAGYAKPGPPIRAAVARIGVGSGVLGRRGLGELEPASGRRLVRAFQQKAAAQEPEEVIRDSLRERLYEGGVVQRQHYPK